MGKPLKLLSLIALEREGRSLKGRAPIVRRVAKALMPPPVILEVMGRPPEGSFEKPESPACIRWWLLPDGSLNTTLLYA